MQKAVLFLGIIISISCKGQLIIVDTTLAKTTISTVDSLTSLKSIIVRKYRHNETIVDHGFLFDTSSLKILRLDYLILDIIGVNDTISITSSYYIHDNQFVAVVHRKFRNNKEVTSQVFFLKSHDGEVKKIISNSNQTTLTQDEIKY